MSVYDLILKLLMQDGGAGESASVPILLFIMFFSGLSRMFLFRKVGKKPWLAWIPFVNNYNLYDAAWDGRVYFIVAALTAVNTVLGRSVGIQAARFRLRLFILTFLYYFAMSVIMKLKLARSFSRSIAFAFGLVFMEDLFYLILGLDKSVYQGQTLRAYNPKDLEENLGRTRVRRKKRQYLIDVTKRNSVLALLMSVLVLFFTFYAVAGGLIQNPNEISPERGEYLYRLFTVNSNTLSALGASFLIPFAVEGIRNKRFIVPKWVAMFQYSGAICTTLTMLFAAFLILPAKGFTIAFTGMNFWLHVVCPIMALILVFLTESRYHLTMEDALIALIPFFLYAEVYIFNVVLLGETGGGWRDIYRLATYLPASVSAPMMFMLAFGIALLIRHFFNKINSRRRDHMAAIWAADMDPVEIKIELFGLGRNRGLHCDAHEMILPMEIFEDIRETHDIPMDDLVRSYSHGIHDGLKDKSTLQKRRSRWFSHLIGTPKNEQKTAE